MDNHAIHTEADYKAALKIVSRYFDEEPAAETEDAKKFELLLTLIPTYEAKHYPVLSPDPISVHN